MPEQYRVDWCVRGTAHIWHATAIVEDTLHAAQRRAAAIEAADPARQTRVVRVPDDEPGVLAMLRLWAPIHWAWLALECQRCA